MAQGYKEVLAVESINIASVTPYYSQAVDLHRSDKISFQLVYTNGAGTGRLQLSNNGTDWADVDDTAITLSGTDNAMWDILDTSACAARLKFLSGSTMTGSLYKCVR